MAGAAVVVTGVRLRAGRAKPPPLRFAARRCGPCRATAVEQEYPAPLHFLICTEQNGCPLMVVQEADWRLSWRFRGGTGAPISTLTQGAHRQPMTRSHVIWRASLTRANAQKASN